MTFVVGQRVRVKEYITWPNYCGDPHFIVGHFGKVAAIDKTYFDVDITHGPDGGAPDPRVHDAEFEIMGTVWPMLASELEAVD